MTHKTNGLRIFSASLVKLALLHAYTQSGQERSLSQGLTGDKDLYKHGRSFSSSRSYSRCLESS